MSNWEQVLLKVTPNANRAIIKGIADTMPILIEKAKIDTVGRQCHFFTQTGYESQYFSRLTENMNYSSTRLLQVFPKYFKNIVDANRYDRKPEAIANRVYANRMGNGPESSGDGWRNRGMGIIQITGANNRKECAAYLLKHFGIKITSPDDWAEFPVAILSACWFWDANNLNRFADRDLQDLENVTAITKVINGGTHGLAERKALYTKFLRVYGV